MAKRYALGPWTMAYGLWPMERSIAGRGGVMRYEGAIPYGPITQALRSRYLAAWFSNFRLLESDRMSCWNALPVQ